MEFQRLQLYRVQFRCYRNTDANADGDPHRHTDSFKCFSFAFGFTDQHSNRRHGHIHYFNSWSDIDWRHSLLCNEWYRHNGLQLLS